MKKRIFVLLMLCFGLLSGCEQKDNEVTKNSSITKIVLLKNFGERIQTKPIGLNTEYITLYTNKKELNIIDVVFSTKSQGTFKFNHINEQSYKEGKFIYIGYDNPDFKSFAINKVAISTDVGDYEIYVDLATMQEIESVNPSNNEIISVNKFDGVFLDWTLEEDYKVPISLNVLEDNVLIKNIELLNSDKYPKSLELDKVYLNGVEFIQDNTSFIYNAGKLDLRVTLTDYYLGHYVFKVTYIYENQEYYLYTSAISVNLSIDEYNIQNKKFSDKLKQYLNEDYSNEFTKKD